MCFDRFKLFRTYQVSVNATFLSIVNVTIIKIDVSAVSALTAQIKVKVFLDVEFHQKAIVSMYGAMNL